MISHTEQALFFVRIDKWLKVLLIFDGTPITLSTLSFLAPYSMIKKRVEKT